MSIEEEYNRVKRKLAEIIGDNYPDRSMWSLLARVEKHIAALSAQNAALRKALENCGRYFAEHDRDEEDAAMLDEVRAALSLPAPSPSRVASLVEAAMEWRSAHMAWKDGWGDAVQKIANLADEKLLAAVANYLALTGKGPGDG